MTGIAANLISTPAASQSSGGKKSVLVIGAGIAGLSCAYELMRRGHNVTVLEASGRAGGHVRTSHDPFADGLYADLGAEHFYYPGYTEYWRYLKEFSLTPIAVSAARQHGALPERRAVHGGRSPKPVGPQLNSGSISGKRIFCRSIPGRNCRFFTCSDTSTWSATKPIRLSQACVRSIKSASGSC